LRYLADYEQLFVKLAKQAEHQTIEWSEMTNELSYDWQFTYVEEKHEDGRISFPLDFCSNVPI
jgi:hypothetical protein